MPVRVGDTLKPANGLNFPVAEAEDISIGEDRLPAALNKKYTKPSGGIPAADLSDEVKAMMGGADPDTITQAVQDYLAENPVEAYDDTEIRKELSQRKGFNSVDFNGLGLYQIKDADVQFGKALVGYNTTTFLPIVQTATSFPDAVVLDCPVQSLIELGIEVITIPPKFGSYANRCIQYTEGVKATNALPTNRGYKVSSDYERVALLFENKSELLQCVRNMEDVEINVTNYVGEDALKNEIKDKVKFGVSKFNAERTREVYSNYFGGQFLSIEVFNGNPEIYEYRIDNVFKAHVSIKTRQVTLHIYRKSDGSLYCETKFSASNGESNVPPDVEFISFSEAVTGTVVNILMDWTQDANSYVKGAVLSDEVVHTYPIPRTSTDTDEERVKEIIREADGDLSLVFKENSENKYSGLYDTSTRLPVWNENDDRITFYIPIPKYGKIRTPLSTISSLQSYLLKEDGTVVSNYVNSGTAKEENSAGFSRTDTECILNCEKAYATKAVYWTITFSVLQDYYIKAEGSYIPEWLNVNAIADLVNVNENIESVLPRNLVVCGGREMNIYYQNIMRYINTEKCHMVNVRGNNYFSSYQTDFARWTAPDTIDTSFGMYFDIFTKNTASADVVTSSMNVIGIPKSSGSGLSKKVMFIGDSLTDAGVYPKEIKNLFASDVMNVELVGTLDVSTGADEGRSGWRAFTYCRCQSNVEDWATWGGTPSTTIVNPFYNSNTGKFDFSMYMRNNGFSGIDYVFICLGTNDIARGNHQTESELKEYWDEMIASIKSYNPDVRIGLWLPPTRSLYKNYSRKSIDTSLKMNKWLIQTYDNRQNENLYLIPIYMNVDPYHDYRYEERPVSARNNKYTMQICTDQVHPADEGYYKMADVIYSYIKYFGKLDTN